MEELSERQTKILKTIIEDYVETAEPVGSQKLEKKYELGVSPATIRNEMTELAKSGFLKQPHTSAGRVPTKQAFKFYVNQLMEEKKLSVAEEVAAKEKIWDARFNFEQLLREATRALAKQTQNLAVAVTEEGELFHSGYAYLLDLPEFFDIDVAKSVFSLIDEASHLSSLFGKSFGEGSTHLLVGDEMGWEFLEPCSLVFVHFEAGPGKKGSLGVIGPCRLDYSRVIPTVRYFGNLIEELAKGL